MILPITVLGDTVLRRKADEIPQNYEGLTELIANMYETMHQAEGVGLAAPQIDRSVRLFIVDAEPLVDDDDKEDKQGLRQFKKVFINPQILEEWGDEWYYREGCLSIPGLREDVKRKPSLRIRYMDENFQQHEEVFDGMKARIIQHEYDHIEGILFIDRLSPLRKKLITARINAISKGNFEASYRVKRPSKK